jgi:hypothetical protein
MRTMFGHTWGGWNPERPGPWWRLATRVQARREAFRIARGNGRQDAVSACLYMLLERPRTRQFQRSPRRVGAL